MSLKELSQKPVLTLFIIAITITPLIYLPYPDDALTTSFVMRDGAGNVVYHSIKDTIYKPKIDFLLVIVLLLLISLFLRSRQDKLKLAWQTVYLPLISFLSLITLATIFSPYREIAIFGKFKRHEGLLAFIAYISLFFLATIIIKNRKELKIVIKYLLFSSVLISVYGILQYLGLDFIARDPIRSGWTRAFSTLGNPNFAGSYISLLFPISFILYYYAQSKKQVILIGIITTIHYSFLVATGTRSAYLAILSLIPIFLYLHRDTLLENKRRLITILIIFSFATMLLNLAQDDYPLERFSSIFSDGRTVITGSEAKRDSAGASRAFIYRTSLPLLLENPILGQGLDTFHLIYPQEKYRSYSGNQNRTLDKAHSEYLQLGITVGLPALLAYLWFIFRVLKVNLKLIQAKDKYQLALLLAIISYLVQATFNISVVSVGPIFWALLGLSLASCQVVKGCVLSGN